MALGLRSGAAPDRFLVGLAILNLLAEVAEDRPLACVVDDAQWLDQTSAQVPAFVTRRVGAERVVLVFALHLGIAGEALDPAEAAGLVDVDARVRSRHASAHEEADVLLGGRFPVET